VYLVVKEYVEAWKVDGSNVLIPAEWEGDDSAVEELQVEAKGVGLSR